MTIYATPGSTFEADSSGATTGLVGTIGVRIRNPVSNADFLARTTAGITEQPAGSALYFVSLTAPTTLGTYSVIWDNGSGSYAAEDLVVSYTLVSPGASGPNLCSLADVRTALELATGETGRDATITANLSAVDKAIVQYCNREFLNTAPGSDATPRKFHYLGGRRMSLSPYDAQSVSRVQMDTDTTSPFDLVIVTDYYLEPLPASDGVYTHLYFPGLLPADLGDVDTRREVSVTGVWGFPAVPADVKRAAVLTHLSWLDKAVSEYGGNAPSSDGRALRPAAGGGLYIPAPARAILEDYARAGVA